MGNDIDSLSFNGSGWMQSGNESKKFFIAPMR